MIYSKSRIVSIFLLASGISVYPFFLASAKTTEGQKVKYSAISKKDILQAIEIQGFFKKKKWNSIKRQISTIKNPSLKKTLIWQRYTSQNSGATFEEIRQFIKKEANWPSQRLLHQRAEEAMNFGTDPKQVIAWFIPKGPLTANGGILLGNALQKQARKMEATTVFRETWINKNFSPKQERNFYKRYRSLLTRQDHIDRLERLLWRGNYYPVRRMLQKVNKDYRALAFARITLRRYRGSVDLAISKVPNKFIDNPGLIFERLRWRRRKGRNLDAIKLLKKSPENYSHHEDWWREKSILTRRALTAGSVSDAYNIAKSHGLKQGIGFAEGEWLSGWISLRFLKDRKPAIKHFENLYKGSNYPISRARGAYWAGRAAEALHDQKRALNWYQKAAAYQLTFYGQLAKTKIKTNNVISIPPVYLISKKETENYASNELINAVRMLKKIKAFEQIGPFINKLIQVNTSKRWLSYIAKIARESGRPDLAIYTAKKAYRSNTTIIREGYPILAIKRHHKIEPALVHAIIRQESAFNIKAISRAGALGLMQIMPATAKLVTKQHKLHYNRHELTKNMNYNLKIGQAYLSGLLKHFNGSYVLSLAAYNAGASRIKRWIVHNGDPRDNSVDPIDWIEKIPFTETRNYVQRVLENLTVYRIILNKPVTHFNKKNSLPYWKLKVDRAITHN